MMNRYFLLVLLCISHDVITVPTLSKRNKNDQKRQQIYEVRQEANQWQQQNLPFINRDTKNPYSLLGLIALTILSGPVMMIQPVVRPIDLLKISTEDTRYASISQQYLKYHQLPKQDKIQSTKKQIHKHFIKK